MQNNNVFTNDNNSSLKTNDTNNNNNNDDNNNNVDNNIINININNTIDTHIKNLKEKVVCKKCGAITYRDLEQYEIYKEDINKETKRLYAVFVKKFKCPKCKSINYNSYICDMNKENLLNTEAQSIINLDLAKKEKETNIIKNNVMLV